MIWSTITQKDLELSTDKTDLPYQYSDGITLKFMKDTKYNGYAVVPYVGVCDTELISCVDKFERLQALTMNVDGTFKVSNKVMFNSGYLYVAFDLVSSNEIIHVGNVIYKINASIGNAAVLPEDDLTWQEVVKSFMEEYERINFTEKINALISTAEEQQKNVTSLQTSVNSAIKTLNALLNSMQDKLSNGDFVPNITLGNVSIGVPNVSFRGTGKDVIVDFTMPEFAGIEEYDKVIRDYIFEVGTDYYAKVESDEYSGHTYNSGVDLLKIDGAYSQETTNGFQLFDASKLPTKSQGGATVTHNGDSSFTISGSGDLTGDFSYCYNYSHEETLKMLKVGKITLNQNGDDTTPYAMFRLVKGDSGLWLQLIKTVRSANITQEMLQDSGCYMQVLIYGQRGSTIKGGTIKPMLYQDGDGTFEPFTGGIASPNPEYAQEPKFVGDIGQNLFDASKLPTKSQGGATVTNNGDGSFTISGSGNLSESFALYYELTNEEIKKIFKVGKLTLKNDIVSNPILYIDFKVGSSIKLSLTNSNLSVISGDLTEEIYNTEGLIAKVGFYGTSGMSIVGGTIKPMLYQDGDGTYRPFSETPKYYLDFVTSGKNLVNLDDVKKALGSIITIDKTSGYFNLTDNKSTTFKSVFPNLKVGKTYRIIANVLSGKTYIWYGKDGWVANKTLTITNEIYNGNLTFYISEWNNFMIVEDSETITSYAPYQGLETTTLQLNQPLRALPNSVKDTIENGIATRRVGEITFDGSSDESWNLNGTYGEKYIRFSASASNVVTSQYKIGNVICDKFLYRPYEGADVSPDNEYIIAGSGYIYVLIEKSRLSESTAQGFKTWLQSNPITVWYELATPTTEQITLPTLPSWYPYANIWQAQEVKANVIYGIRSNSNIGMDIVDKAINDAINKAMQDIITNAELIEVLKSYLPLTGGNITGSLTINNNVAINSRDTSNVIRSLAKITAENITALGSIYLPLQLYGNTAPAWNNGSVKKTLATLDDIPPIKKVTTTVNVHNEMDPQLLELSLPTGYTTANTTIVAFNEYSNNIKSVPTYSTANLTANNKIQISYIYTGSDTKTVTLEVTVMKSA